MESIIYFMDNFIIHPAPLPRRYPHDLPVATLGYLAEKPEWVRTAFSSFNFSFILRGRGEYHREGETWAVEAPCVLTQWPGIFVEYGPEKTWEEVYLIYPSNCLPILEARRFANPSRPVWYVRDSSLLRRHVRELVELCRNLSLPGRADEIDRMCERMVLESLLSEDRPAPAEEDQALRAIRTHVEEHYAEQLDFDALARRFALSPATFRRRWARQVSLPPGEYVTHLRMQQACRLLAETQQPIGDVARATGYHDVLYFSRRFRQCMGETARQYRRRNQAPSARSHKGKKKKQTLPREGSDVPASSIFRRRFSMI